MLHFIGLITIELFHTASKKIDNEHRLMFHSSFVSMSKQYEINLLKLQIHMKINCFKNIVIKITLQRWLQHLEEQYDREKYFCFQRQVQR